MVNAFGRVLIVEKALAKVLGLGGKVGEGKSLSKRDLSTSPRKDCILSLCLVCTSVTAVVMADIITLTIDFSQERSILYN